MDTSHGTVLLSERGSPGLETSFLMSEYRTPYFVMNSNTFRLIVGSHGRCKQCKDGRAHKGVLKTAIYLYTQNALENAARRFWTPSNHVYRTLPGGFSWSPAR